MTQLGAKDQSERQEWRDAIHEVIENVGGPAMVCFIGERAGFQHFCVAFVDVKSDAWRATVMTKEGHRERERERDADLSGRVEYGLYRSRCLLCFLYCVTHMCTSFSTSKAPSTLPVIRKFIVYLQNHGFISTCFACFSLFSTALDRRYSEFHV